MLGTRTGWTRTEILSLPRNEFEFYVRALVDLADPENN